ncbi:hypothetical protein CIB84_006141, partial [Bambusicola thoracicus]
GQTTRGSEPWESDGIPAACVSHLCFSSWSRKTLKQGISVTSHLNMEVGEQFISAENHSLDLRLGSLLRALGVRSREICPLPQGSA